MSNSIKQAFDTVCASQELKNSTMQFLENNAFSKRKTKLHFARYAAVVACFLIVAFGAVTTSLYFTPVAAVSIDVNPSVEMQINCFERVISVKGYGSEAQSITEEISVNNMKYDKALDTLLCSAQMSEYLSADACIDITFSCENQDKCDTMQKSISDCINRGNYKAECEVSALDNEQAQAAKESSMSMGKYKAFLTLKELNPEITQEEVQDLTMSQIRELISQYSATSENDTDEESTTQPCEACSQADGSKGEHKGKNNQSKGKHKNKNS